MNIKDIEYLWKVASNNPHHDSNWHDPVVVAFAESVAAHTLLNIDPSKFMSYQEGFEVGNRLAVDGFCKQLRQLHDAYSCASNSSTLRARGAA